MIKPFQIVWELIEFGLQALFLYVLAIILCVGLIAYVIADNKSKESMVESYNPQTKPIVYSKERIEEVKKCMRISGCRVLEDGTVEW